MVSLPKTSNWIMSYVRAGLSRLPGECLLCSRLCQRPSNLCLDCEAQLPFIRHSCRQCAIPLATHNRLCARCILQPPPLHSCLSVLAYQSPVAEFVTGLKFSGRFDYGRVLSELLLAAVTRQYQGEKLPDLIIPVPLHPARWRQRGFNQAQQLLGSVSAQTGIPVSCSQVRRLKATQAQSELHSISARRRNLRNAFTITEKFNAGGKHIVIVDDVITTMATVCTLAECLQKAGVGRIDVWSIARALR